MDVRRSDCIGDDHARQDPGLSPEQLAAAAAPNRATRELIGNFGDFDMLFAQLGEPAVMELGNPLPEEKFMPSVRVGSCPAAHNRALLGEEED